MLAAVGLYYSKSVVWWYSADHSSVNNSEKNANYPEAAAGVLVSGRTAGFQ